VEDKPVADFAKVKAEHSLESVAERLGLALKKHGNAWRGPCPSKPGDERALVLTPGKGWYSFAANKGGDVISLVAFVKGMSVKDAAIWIEGAQRTEPEKSTSSEARGGFKELDYLIHDHEAVVALGIEPEDAKRLGCGYAPRGLMKGTVAWPVRLSDGTLVGYVGCNDVILPPRWNF
jgi:DNA primase